MHGRSGAWQRPRDVVLLGAQRFDETLGTLVRRLECEGPMATITAGWREREDEDQDLRDHLTCKTFNLRLYHRATEVFARDQELAKAHRHKQSMLHHKQDFYRIRLEHEIAANHVIRQRWAPPEVHQHEEAASVSAIRSLDAYHLEQCRQANAEFEAAVGLYERPSIVEQRQELAEILAGCQGLAIAGGHVELFDEGLGLVPDVVALPQPETRLRLHDGERVSLLARRFAPAACLALPAGTHAILRDGQLVAASGVSHLLPEGACKLLEERIA